MVNSEIVSSDVAMLLIVCVDSVILSQVCDVFRPTPTKRFGGLQTLDIFRFVCDCQVAHFGLRLIIPKTNSKTNDVRGVTMSVGKTNIALPIVCGIAAVGIAVVVTASTVYQVQNMQSQAANVVQSVSDATVAVYEQALDTYKSNYEAAIAANETPALVISDATSVQSVIEQMGIDSSLIRQDSDGTYVYLIQPGDTLSKLSAVFGYSVDEIANFNQIRNVNLIYDGSALRIPNGV